MDALLFSRFLRYFVVVAEAGSIRRAAEVLHVSASAIDRQILRAEADVGMPLFERQPSGLKLTAAGEQLLAASRDWAQAAERLRGRMDDLVGLRRGHVRIAIIGALAAGFLSREIARLHSDMPGITVDAHVLDNVAVMDAVAAGLVDFGIMLNPQSARGISVVAHHPIALGFALPPGHALAGLAAVRFNRALEERIIKPMPPLAVHEQLSVLEAATGITLRPVAQSDSIAMIKSLIRDGGGIAVLTALDVMEEVRQGSLAFTPLSDPVLRPLSLGVCVGQARQLSIAARTFLRRIEEAFSALS
ncbi:LysR family transcriptional regulator [Acidisoma cellulosilytica]|uniref:LysR family transcriptional regulator n=1 Tax=Acidisoma cellulosilyticum TaxID=2802395 RepID=A0A963Z776_9PROT|nr:LysR family transcriptional regulator [Acidisoma cellulosilyticum]MCB8883385.1 LysR family transcriptional regulator [Acidisoma cellulosilyticum]